MLAIAAPAFHRPSETFIRNHVRTIAPGETVLICRDWEDKDLFDCPVLAGVPSPVPLSRNFGERALNSVTARWRGLSLSMARGDEDTLIRFLREYEVRALLVEYLGLGTLFGRAAKRAGVPLYVHAHGFDASYSLKFRVWRQRYRRLFRCASGIIAPSKFLTDKLAAIGCPSEKLHVSPCGVDPDTFQPSRHLQGRLLAVGRLVEKKAPHHTISAFAKVRAKFPQARLDMLGDGPLMVPCKNQIASLRLGDSVALHGAQPSETVHKLMSEASVYVQHSVTAANGDTEGMPVALLEAMSSEVPVVATRHSGIAETVVEGETGFLVNEHDVDGMATAITTLLSDFEHANSMGQAGRRRVLAHFTHQHCRDRLRSVMGFPPLDATDVEGKSHSPFIGQVLRGFKL